MSKINQTEVNTVFPTRSVYLLNAFCKADHSLGKKHDPVLLSLKWRKGDFAKSSGMEWVQETLWNPKDTVKFAFCSGKNFPPLISPGPPRLVIKDVYFVSAESIK